MALQMDTWKGMGTYYHTRLAEIYKYLIPSDIKVLELDM
jgi:hypothetical protein